MGGTPAAAGQLHSWSSIEVVITSTTGNRVTVKSRPRVQIPPAPPYKNANIDTASVNISVLILYPKSLWLQAFLYFWTCSAVLLTRKMHPASEQFCRFPYPRRTICGRGCKISEGGAFFHLGGCKWQKKRGQALQLNLNLRVVFKLKYHSAIMENRSLFQ